MTMEGAFVAVLRGPWDILEVDHLLMDELTRVLRLGTTKLVIDFSGVILDPADDGEWVTGLLTILIRFRLLEIVVPQSDPPRTVDWEMAVTGFSETTTRELQRAFADPPTEDKKIIFARTIPEALAQFKSTWPV